MASMKVALAGATGNLGQPILKNLLDAGFSVIALTRIGSNATSKLPSNANLTIREVNYSSVDSLKAALEGVTAVISTLATAAVGDQNTLIDAAFAAGVKRYIPSEFGSDTSNPNSKALPVYASKIGTQEYLKSKAAEKPDFTYTLVFNQLYFDWGIEQGVFINIKKHQVTIYDGGKHAFSTSRLNTVGRAVVGVLKHLDETKNRPVYVHDTAISPLEALSILKSIDGKEWTTNNVNTTENRERGFAELKKGKEGNVGSAMWSFIESAAFADGFGNDFTGHTDNKLLGVPEMSKQEVEDFLRSMVEKSV